MNTEIKCPLFLFVTVIHISKTCKIKLSYCFSLSNLVLWSNSTSLSLCISSDSAFQIISVCKGTSLGLNIVGGINRNEGPLVYIQEIIPGGDCHKVKAFFHFLPLQTPVLLLNLVLALVCYICTHILNTKCVCVPPCLLF